MKKITILKFVIIVLFTLTSCEKDDEQTCRKTLITMKINGVQHTFEALGKGVGLTENGYELALNFGKITSDPDPYSMKSIMLIMAYESTGKNVIRKLIYQQSINGVNFEDRLNKGDFEDKVITNKSSCFYATFDAVFSDGNQEIAITEASVSYEYEEPF